MEEQFEVFNYEKERKNRLNVVTNDLGNPLSEEQLKEEHDMMTPSVNGGTSVDIKTTTSTTHTTTADHNNTNHENEHNQNNEKEDNVKKVNE